METVEEMSAHFASYSAADWGLDTAPRRKDAAWKVPRKPAIPITKLARRNDGLKYWMWRAFVHLNGCWLNKGTTAALSEEFKQLGGDELEHYRLLAAIARDRHRDGERVFCKRRSATKKRPLATKRRSRAG